MIEHIVSINAAERKQLTIVMSAVEDAQRQLNLLLDWIVMHEQIKSPVVEWRLSEAGLVLVINDSNKGKKDATK